MYDSSVGTCSGTSMSVIIVLVPRWVPLPVSLLREMRRSTFSLASAYNALYMNTVVQLDIK